MWASQWLVKRNSANTGISSQTRIVVAIAIGTIAGCLLGFAFPRHSPPPLLEIHQMHNYTHSQISHSQESCDTSLEKYAALEKENEELRGKLKLTEQIKEDAQKLLEYYGQRNKAGSFGTVKSLRTNPFVFPDESVNPRLSKLLKEVAIDLELVVTLANSNVMDMLKLWVSNVKKVGIKNYMVVALDDGVFTYCKENDVVVYKRDPDEKVDSVGKTGGNHAVSGLKFRILREFLVLGYAVLLSDTDVIFLQNPFRHLHRDCDVESMSDGHTNITAYGFDQPEDNPEMGWGRYVHTMRIWVYNSGFFFIRPTVPAIDLLDRVAARLARENVWDQQAFNEALFLPSHPGYVGLHASRRTMDIYEFMNSKTLFKVVRNDGGLMKVKPVVVHLNSHPDKMERLKAVVDYYVNGKANALKHFPVGSE